MQLMVFSRLHELRESKFAFVSRIEFIRSKLSNFSPHVPGSVGAAERSSAQTELTPATGGAWPGGAARPGPREQLVPGDMTEPGRKEEHTGPGQLSERLMRGGDKAAMIGRQGKGWYN